MKTVKLALLGGAALAVMTVGAQADDLSALKAQIESLNARVAQMEAAPAVPTGYQLLTISEGSQQVIPGLEVRRKDALATGDKATVIGILPAADAPATTEITWSGYARAALVYVSNQGGSDDIDVFARGQIKVSGKTETAVGEVGATIEFRGNFDGRRESTDRVFIEQAWGYWAMTPELTLGGGFTDSLGYVGYGLDGACNCYYTDNAVFIDPDDTSQMRLTYASGPLSAAIAVEDASGSGSMFGGSDSLGGAAEIKYSGDSISGEISGVWRDGGSGNDPWMIGGGFGFALGDMASISLGAGLGEDRFDDDFWIVSGLASTNLSDSVHAEIAAAYQDSDDNADVVTALAGIYYDPVSQLTIGLEGEYINPDGGNNNSFQVDLVTVFRF